MLNEEQLVCGYTDINKKIMWLSACIVNSLNSFEVLFLELVVS